MKVLIQSCVTRRFLGEGDVWQESPREGKDFGSGPNAIAYFTSHPGLRDVQIVLHFEYDSDLDIELRVSRKSQNYGRPVHKTV